MAVSDNKPNSCPPASPPPVRTVANATRRRILVGGAAATPALLAVTTRPARAASLCRSPSAFGSMNVSNPERGLQNCDGLSPGQWLSADPSTWTALDFDKDATRFHSLETGFAGTQFGTMEVRYVLDISNPTEAQQVGRLVAAALLNAAAGLTPVLSVTAVQQIWNDYATVGYYEPAPGMTWKAAEIIDYLGTTMLSTT